MLERGIPNLYGDAIEGIFKSIFDGNNRDFGSNICRLNILIAELAAAGIINKSTSDYFVDLFTQDVSVRNKEVISSYSSEVCVLDKKTHQQEFFKLKDLIELVTLRLCDDFLMKKKLYGHENYDGLKKTLNKYSGMNREMQRKRFIKDSWIDYEVINDFMLYSDNDNGLISLFVEKVDNHYFDFRGEEDRNKRRILLGAKDGQIYRINDKQYASNFGENTFVIFTIERGEVIKFRGCKGTIIGQISTGGVIFRRKNSLRVTNNKGRSRLLAGDVSDLVIDINGEEVYWKNLDKGSFCANKCSEKMLWKGLVFSLYDLENMRFEDTISNRIKCYKFFDESPSPFTVDNIISKLEGIECEVCEGKITHSKNYSRVLERLFSMQESMVSIENAAKAIEQLLDEEAFDAYRSLASSEDKDSILIDSLGVLTRKKRMNQQKHDINAFSKDETFDIDESELDDIDIEELLQFTGEREAERRAMEAKKEWLDIQKMIDEDVRRELEEEEKKINEEEAE